MGLNGNVDITNLLNERDSWMKKYEVMESEYLSLKDKLKNMTDSSNNKNKVKEDYETIVKDMFLRYKYMKNQHEYLNLQNKIINLEKEKEIKKNQELQKIINKNKNEIEGYKKILEKLKYMNADFKKKKNDAENQMYSIIESNIITKNDNILLKDIIKVNDKLNSINKSVHEKIYTEFENIKTKLMQANNKIKKYHEVITEICESYLKYKKNKKKELLEILKINETLKKKLEEKMSIEKYNTEYKNKTENLKTSNILFVYYQIKYNVYNETLDMVLKYVHSIMSSVHRVVSNDFINGKNMVKDSNLPNNIYVFNNSNDVYSSEKINENKHTVANEDNIRKDIFNAFCNNKISKINCNIDLNDLIVSLREKGLKYYIFDTIRNKNSEILSEYDGTTITTLSKNEQKNEQNSFDLFLFNNLNSTNIIHVIYYSIKMINDILECMNITLLLLSYIHDTYLKEAINTIKSSLFVASPQKSNIRFAVNFFITLSDFLFCINKYIQIFKTSTNINHIYLLTNEKLCISFCLCKYILEQYIDKIKIRLFSCNVNYYILESMINKLNESYLDLIKTVQSEKNCNVGDVGLEQKSHSEENTKYILDQKGDDAGQSKVVDKVDTIKETKHIEAINAVEANGETKNTDTINKPEPTSAFEIVTFLNKIVAMSILLVTDKDTYENMFKTIDTKLQKYIITECEEVLKLIKLPNEYISMYSPIKKYNISLDSIKSLINKYKHVIIDIVNNNENMVQLDKDISNDVNNISTNILSEVQFILKNCTNNCSMDITNKEDTFLLKICNKFVEIFNKKILKQHNNDITTTATTTTATTATAATATAATAATTTATTTAVTASTSDINIVKKNIIESNTIGNTIKQLEQEINKYKLDVIFLNKKVNILTMREEKYNKIKIDLDVLRNEKNEYINIINSLKKSKTENSNQLSYITTQLIETKNKYNELLKNYEQKKRYYVGTNQNSTNSDIDIYYMKKIIFNLYNENFLNKINKHYYLFDEKMNYYNTVYDNFSKSNFFYNPHKEEKKNAQEQQFIFKETDTFMQNAHKRNLETEEENILNLKLNNILSNDIYFFNNKHSILYDDIYNCELSRNVLNSPNPNYFKNSLYKTLFVNSFNTEKKNNNNNYEQLHALIDYYKNLKNQILTNLIIMPICGNPTNIQVKQLQSKWRLLHTKLKNFKNIINNYSCSNTNSLVDQSMEQLNKVINITFSETFEKNGENIVQGQNQSQGQSQGGDMVNNNDSDKQDVTYPQTTTQKQSYKIENEKDINLSDKCMLYDADRRPYVYDNKLLLCENSLSYLIQNIFNL
ncbi:conserved protein, unknown function [Hepatocystis sp. ex Piliocolobus tephrosceles]|nr:conserved protein, unknown function [Hepatocystis sp. ex Piliocolobus tephrosceles]